MFEVTPVLDKDVYKIGHPAQYGKNVVKVYSNATARGTRRPNGGIGGIIHFGAQAFVLDFLIDDFNRNFFQKSRSAVMDEYRENVDDVLGPGTDIEHIGELHDLGYLPLHVKGIPEGTFVPYRVPHLTLYNTLPKFYWVTNSIESVLSNRTWKGNTSATTAFMMRRKFEEFAKKTGGDLSFVPWQGHDFSYRGMSGLWDACMSAAGHSLSFTGSDTFPVRTFLKRFYGATGLIIGSVPATEHSVMCMGLEEGELETFKRLITETYPKGIVSIVSDTWDLERVVMEFLPKLKDAIMAREGKVVIRPDSGDPVKITCGDPQGATPFYRMGLTKALYEIFPGPTNHAGFRSLDPHIGWIYGDSITLDRQEQILSRLYNQGFVSTTPVLGVGSYTYEYVTRDTDGQAMKATYGEKLIDLKVVAQDIFKAPKTDSGEKNSAKGLLKVDKDPNGKLYLQQGVDWDTESTGELQDIFIDGKAYNFQTLPQIRARVEAQL